MKWRPSIVLWFILFVSSQLHAQQTDSTATVVKQKSKLTWLYIPSGLIIGGVAVNGNGREGLKKEIAEERDEHLGKFTTHIDNYLQYSPVVIAYGLDALGIRSKTDIADRSVILLKGELLMTGVVFSLKKITHQLRPDHSGYNSFPSGHTAQAFAAATFLSEEYKHRFKWMPYAAYAIASSVGMLRMANNKHYISDVLAGAGFGILSMKIAYLTHQYRWGKKHTTSLRYIY